MKRQTGNRFLGRSRFLRWPLAGDCRPGHVSRPSACPMRQRAGRKRGRQFPATASGGRFPVPAGEARTATADGGRGPVPRAASGSRAGQGAVNFCHGADGFPMRGRSLADGSRLPMPAGHGASAGGEGAGSGRTRPASRAVPAARFKPGWHGPVKSRRCWRQVSRQRGARHHFPARVKAAAPVPASRLPVCGGGSRSAAEGHGLRRTAPAHTGATLPLPSCPQNPPKVRARREETGLP